MRRSRRAPEQCIRQREPALRRLQEARLKQSPLVPLFVGGGNSTMKGTLVLTASSPSLWLMCIY